MEIPGPAFPDKPGDSAGADGTRAAGAAGPTASQCFVAKCMEEVLELPSVALADDFYSLGGNSFQLMALIGRLNSLAAVEIDVEQILREPSVRIIAESLEQALSGNYRPAEATG
jgi:acyl carrier protein